MNLQCGPKTRGATPIPQNMTQASDLADILDGKIIIHCHSYRADEIMR